MSVTNALNTTLYSVLSGGTALTGLLNSATSIYYQQAPEGASLPYVVFSHQAGGPENITPSDMRSQLVYVRGFGTAQAQAGTIDTQINALLHQKTLSVSGYTNFWTVRETDVYPPVENRPNGVTVYGAGAFYRIRLDS